MVRLARVHGTARAAPGQRRDRHGDGRGRELRRPAIPATLRSIKWYPTVPRRRATTIAADACIVVLVAVFGWFADSAHDAVNDMAALARGLEEAGTGTEAALEAAAGRVSGVPLIGGALADALRATGDGTGGEAAALGRTGRREIEHAADVIGWALFLIPVVLLLIGYLPNRWSQISRLTSARRILGDGRTVDSHPRLIAMRAAFGLPYATLARYTDDPFGDLEAGRYRALVEAAHEEAGLRWDPDAGARRPAVP